MDRSPDETAASDARALARRHLRLGWWALLVYLSIGIGLESLHAFKVRWYLDVGHDTRRLLLTLAHAHGVLLALVNVALGATLRSDAFAPHARVRRASVALAAATVLLPAGFALGGLFIHGADPGLGISLVPIGGASLFAAVYWIARST